MTRITPIGYAAHMAKVAMKIMRRITPKGTPRVLDPSANTGSLARACREAGAAVLCVEPDEFAARYLTTDGYPTIQREFLNLMPARSLFDGVVMNPPMADEVAYVLHALTFLKTGGALVAVISPAWRDRQPKFRNFSEMISALDAEIHEVPSGTFKCEDRPVATVMIVITKKS